jgi:hypothetical protein
MFGIGFVNLVWIAFNLWIYRRMGSRVHVRSVPFGASRDTLGRTLRGPSWEALRRVPQITIFVDESCATKIYSTSPLENKPPK